MRLGALRFWVVVSGVMFAAACGRTSKNGAPGGSDGGASSSPGASQNPAQPAAPRATEPDGSCKPEFAQSAYPAPGNNTAEIEETLAQAYCSPDKQRCAELPTPQPPYVDHDDVRVLTPSRNAWVSYCQALLANEPQQCESLESGTDPDLRLSCEGFFQHVAELNDDSPAFCLEQLGKTYHSTRDVASCLFAWADSVYGPMTAEQCAAAQLTAPFTQLDLDLWCCLRSPWDSVQPASEATQEQCLYDLAQSSGDARVCQLLIDHNETNPLGQPSCLKALGQ